MTVLKKHTAAILLTTILVATLLVYWPALSGPFVLDDEINITRNSSVSITELDSDSIASALSASSSQLKRPFAYLTFAVNHYFAGSFESSTPYKAVNLAIHLINIVLVYFLARQLLRAPAFGTGKPHYLHPLTALLCAAIWGLHPINVTGVVYIVQRMNELSATFTLSGLLAFTYGRAMLARNRKMALSLMYGGIIGGCILGVAAKENAILLPLLAFVVDATLFRSLDRNKVLTMALAAFYFLVIILPAVVIIAYLISSPDFLLEPYTARSFTITERLLTEARVLWYYVHLITIPDASKFGLFHDDIPISTSLLSPPTTLMAVSGLIAAVSICIVFRRAASVAFAIAWFLCAHLLESTVIGLEIAFEHRNYIPSIGIIFALSHGLIQYVASPTRHSSVVKRILPISLITTLWFVTHVVVISWKDVHTLAAQLVRTHPDSPRANDFASTVSLNIGDITSAEHFATRAAQLAPSETGYQVNLHMVYAIAESAGAGHAKLLADCQNASEDHRQLQRCPLERSATIEKFLHTERISAVTTATLANLRICLTERAGCEKLEPIARQWFAAALSNSRVTAPALEYLAFNAALVHAHSGDYHGALTYIRKAIKLAPDVLAYRVGETDFLIHLKRFDEAEEVLRQIDEDNRHSARATKLNEPKLQQLRTLVRSRRQGTQR